jgi:Phage tail assembly chaperone proteins, E, or 41 or 14
LNKALREGFVSGEADDEPRGIEHDPMANHPNVRLDGPSRAPAPRNTDADAPAPFDPDAPAEDVQWPQVFKLQYRPTRDMKNNVIHELRLRAPTAKDIRACGDPVRIDRNSDVIADPDAMIQMIATLSGCHAPMIGELDARDYKSISFYLQRFFLPNSGSWPTQS